MNNMIPKLLGHRGDFVRDKRPSPVPEGYEDVNPNAFIELKRDGKPVTYHKGYYYRQTNGIGHGRSWASKMNREKSR